MKKTKSMTSTALYTLSVILILLGSVQLFQATSYILSSISAGNVSWGADFVTIISYISQACISAYSFAVIFYVMGKGYAMLIAKNEEKE